MATLIRRPQRALMTLAIALLAGCGGGNSEDTSSSQTTGSGLGEAAALAETAAYTDSRASALAAVKASPTLTVRARATLYGGVGASMQVRVDDVLVGSAQVNNTDWVDFSFSAPTLRGGSKIEVVFTNDACCLNNEDRNLSVAYLTDGTTTVLPASTGSVIDYGSGAAAFDGLNTIAGQEDIWGNGALRVRWPLGVTQTTPTLARRIDAARFLQQATFGPTTAMLNTLAVQTYANWISAQMALPATGDFVNAVQARYNLGTDYRPGGTLYSPYEVSKTFWRTASKGSDQLRKRTAFALHQIFMISQNDSNLWFHGRAYASYLDALNRNAFGNFRTLLEDIALSPAMGIYLSHMRNRPEDPVTGRLPDENFAREVMQLFTIGLYELNNDGTLKRDASGNPIETYSNADVMALAKVFTGFSWAFPDSQLDEAHFRWYDPDYTAGNDQNIDLLPMKAYPGQHSTATKTLFAGKSWAATLPAGGSAAGDLKTALDTLFKHPNVGPFISRQLIQHLVTSEPSPAYVGRIAAVFNNNGSGVRGDLAAVVRAILLDTEARGTPSANFGKLREPVLRVAHWMRAFNATSTTGDYNIGWQLDQTGQSPNYANSVFGYFRPGYVPPNTAFSTRGATAPEFQIVNENTAAGWVNVAEAMGDGGLGWANGAREVQPDYNALRTKLTGPNGSLGALVDEINILMFGGRMSATLRQAIIEAVASCYGSDATSNIYRVRMAVFMALASPEYLVQR